MARPRGTGGKAKPLTREEIKRIDLCLTGTIHEHRNRLLLYLGLGSGMRVAELAQLTVGDVAPFGRVVSQVVLEKHSTKSKRSRTVYLSIQAMSYIKKYLVLFDDVSDKTPLFASQKRQGSPLTANATVKVLGRMFEAAGVEAASSHSLRRTHANELRRLGVDLKIIQEQLGHASLALTERYFDVDPVEKEAALARLKF